MAKNTKKQNALGSVASIQTILERYPVLITNDEVGNTSLSFTFDMLDILGVSSEDIFNWLSKLLSDKDGWLDTLEWAIKSILVTTFKDTYTCSINPRLPMSALRSVYDSYPTLISTGIKINLDDIDVFGILNNCPTTEEGSIYYFDASPDNGYTPTNVYSSTDFNAYLWYIINKGQTPPEHKSVWDNRNDYRSRDSFELIGNFAENSQKGLFLTNDGREALCNKTSIIKTSVGPKKEILSCQFNEGAGTNSNYLTVFINADRYFNGLFTKTIFEFNFDYIMSLKLFDSTTLVAQIVNAISGLSRKTTVGMSFEREVIAAKVKEIVKKIIENDDDEVEDCYFSFSNEEYDKLLKETEQRYNGNFQAEDDKTESEEIISEVKKINAASKGEKAETIKNVLKEITETVSSYNNNQGYNVSFNGNIIKEFLEETVLQITLQILSPKVMLLFAINEKVMNPNPNPEESETNGIIEFFKKFNNLIVSLTKQIFNLVMEYLAEFLISELKLILYLFIEKILLEKIGYYMLLIEQLITSCTMGIGNISLSFTGRRNNPLSIEDVRGADIIPSQDSPVTKKC